MVLTIYTPAHTHTHTHPLKLAQTRHMHANMHIIVICCCCLFCVMSTALRHVVIAIFITSTVCGSNVRASPAACSLWDDGSAANVACRRHHHPRVHTNCLTSLAPSSGSLPHCLPAISIGVLDGAYFYDN